MRSTFERTNTMDLKSWDQMIQDLRQVLSDLRSGSLSQEDVREFVSSHISLMGEDGAWGFDSLRNLPSDARISYYYVPTYISTAILMRANFDCSEVANEIEGFLPAMCKALETCCQASFRGHGYDDFTDTLDALQILGEGGAAKLLENTDLCPVFSRTLEKQLAAMRETLVSGNTKSVWGEDYAMKIADTLRLYPQSETVIFVYGTLLKGESNHDHYLSDSAFLGGALLDHYALYDLGSFPAILPGVDFCVCGELYQVTRKELARIDLLEREGYLYRRQTVRVLIGSKYRLADTYVFLRDLEGPNYIPSEKSAWGHRNYVWYACYGSNLLSERFDLYIKGGWSRFNGREYKACNDTAAPIAAIPLSIPYELYFGNQSPSWSNSGVAFIDRNSPSNTLGKAYLITHEQFEQVWEKEGRRSNWYNEEIHLGKRCCLPVITITNQQRRPEYSPSQEYRDVIIQGLQETYPEMSQEDVRMYLEERI